MSLFDRIAAAIQPAGLAVYGTSIQYQSPSGAPFTVEGVILPAQPLEEVDAAYQMLWVRASDFAAEPAKGDSVTVAGVSYVVVKVTPDGPITPSGGPNGYYLMANQTDRDPNA